MLHFTIVLNIFVTVLSAIGSFLQYHFLTDAFPNLTKDISNSSALANFFSVLSLSLPFVISHLVSSANFVSGSLHEATTLEHIYKKVISLVILAIGIIGAGFCFFSRWDFGILLFLFSANILLKNILYAKLGFYNGFGWVLEENFLKLISALSIILTSAFLTKIGVWVPLACQMVVLLTLNFLARLKLKKYVPAEITSARDLSPATRRSVRNHFLISIPSYFIFNLNILVSSHFLSDEALQSLVKHIYLVQGFVTVIASSVRIVARNFNVFFLQKKQSLLQEFVNFYLKVTLLFLPFFLVIYLVFEPEWFVRFLKLGREITPAITYAFILFVGVECYQVALTGMSYAAGKTEYHKVTWASAIFGIILNVMMVPFWGINGSILALIISQQVTCNTFNFAKFRKEFGLKLLFLKDVARSALVFTILVPAIYFLKGFSQGFYLLTLLALLILFNSTYNNLRLVQKVEPNVT